MAARSDLFQIFQLSHVNQDVNRHTVDVDMLLGEYDTQKRNIIDISSYPRIARIFFFLYIMMLSLVFHDRRWSFVSLIEDRDIPSCHTLE